MSQREGRINDALRYHGLSVIIRNKQKLTGIVIWSNMKEFSTGSVGCAQSQKESFIRVVEFNDFFKV